MKLTVLTEPNQPLVSIIIPNYNHAQFVEDAIQSVMDQDYRHFEIIVVDDGSTDNSREVVARFGDKVRYIWQENQGLSAARNTGIKAAQGSLIGVLDADDMYEPAFLSTLVSSLEANPDADGIYCGYQFVDQANNLLPQIEARAVPSDELFMALLDGNFLVPESMFVHRRCYENMGTFDESLRACEDWDMWLRFTRQYKIIFTTQILTRHRILAGSMSTDPLRMLNNRLAVLKKHVGEEPVEGTAKGNVSWRAYGRAYLGSCVEYLQYGNMDRARECFQKMAVNCPELLTQIDTFYQLGCGDQPKGSMGDLASLNVRRNSQMLLDLVGALFKNTEMSNQLKQYQRASFANAYYALGMLAYGAREFHQARHFLSRAVLTDSKLILNRQLVVLWIKSLFGPWTINRLKRVRARLASLRSPSVQSSSDR